MINGIRFRGRTGVPWRDVPVEYGPWGRVHGLFRRRLFRRRAVPGDTTNSRSTPRRPSFSRPVSEWR
ncbi:MULTISPECIES: transposase [unclassified Streptomyces]|uniref:transposase n=1 Tax=unclassified Streptomyces TaxID=2593676 RepID=UPI0021C67012|nr:MULTISPECIES: transposase [unclassified Streptomyces]MDX3428134.1 transposase [Streptomyces sp. ME01-18a]